jgi:hypothetical protein
MLRILRAMQFLTMLMVQVPERVGTERERLEQLLADGLRTVQTTIESSRAYQEHMDQKLERLPDKIAAGISPETIARAINESLRQQFVKSTIPETAGALSGFSPPKVPTSMRSICSTMARGSTTSVSRCRTWMPA